MSSIEETVRLEAQRLELHDGDIVVVSFEDPQSEVHMVRLRDALLEHFPDHVVVVLEGGATIDAVPREKLVKLLEDLAP